MHAATCTAFCGARCTPCEPKMFGRVALRAASGASRVCGAWRHAAASVARTPALVGGRTMAAAQAVPKASAMCARRITVSSAAHGSHSTSAVVEAGTVVVEGDAAANGASGVRVKWADGCSGTFHALWLRYVWLWLWLWLWLCVVSHPPLTHPHCCCAVVVQRQLPVCRVFRRADTTTHRRHQIRPSTPFPRHS